MFLCLLSCTRCNLHSLLPPYPIDEVGAVDSIVDTVGTLLMLHYLGVDLGDNDKKVAVTCSALPLGEGTVWTDHGLLPVPAPATLRLMVGMPTCPGPKGVTGELVTPTAAALLRVLTGVSSSSSTAYKNHNDSDVTTAWQPTKIPGRPPCMIPCAIGVGAGTKDFERHPNVLRLILGHDLQQQQQSLSDDTDETQEVDTSPNTDRNVLHAHPTANNNSKVCKDSNTDTQKGSEGKMEY